MRNITNGIKVDQEIIVQDLVVVSVARVGLEIKADSEVQIVSATKADSGDQIRSAAKTDSGDQIRSATKADSGDQIRSATKADSRDQIRSATKADSGDQIRSATKADSGDQIRSAVKADSVDKMALEVVKMVLVSMAIGQPINSQTTTTMEISSVQTAISGADQMKTIGGKVVIDAVTTSMAMGETEITTGTIEETGDITNINGTIVLRSS